MKIHFVSGGKGAVRNVYIFTQRREGILFLMKRPWNNLSGKGSLRDEYLASRLKDNTNTFYRRGAEARGDNLLL